MTESKKDEAGRSKVRWKEISGTRTEPEGGWARAPQGSPEQTGRLAVYDLPHVELAEDFPVGWEEPVAMPVEQAARLDPERFVVEDANSWAPLGTVAYQAHGLVPESESALEGGGRAGLCALVRDTASHLPAPAAPGHAEQEDEDEQGPAEPERIAPVHPEAGTQPVPPRRTKLRQLIKAGLLVPGDELVPVTGLVVVTEAGTALGPHGESLYEPGRLQARWAVRRAGTSELVMLEDLRARYAELEASPGA